MNKKRVLLAILTGTMLLQVGCGTSKAGSDEKSLGKVLEDKQLCDNVTLDDSFEIEDDIPTDVKVYSAEEVDYDKDDVIEAFGVDKSQLEVVSEEYGVYKAGDISFNILSGVSSSMSIQTKNADYYHYYDSYYADYVSDDDLTFCDRETAIKDAESVLKKMGMDSLTCYESYALPLEYHKKVEEDAAEEGFGEEPLSDEQWQALGDCYELIFTSKIDDIDMEPKGYEASDDSMCNGGKIVVFYNADGIAYLDAANRYATTDDGEEVDVIDGESILSSLKEKMDSQILTSNYRVMSENLEYYPSLIDIKENKFELIPVWKITLQSDDEEEGNIEYLFDAQSGKELIC